MDRNIVIDSPGTKQGNGAQAEVISGIRPGLPKYIEVPLVYVLSHNCGQKVSLFIDEMTKAEESGIPQTQQQTQEEIADGFDDFSNRCATIAGIIKQQEKMSKAICLPFGGVEPILVTFLSQCSVPELQLVKESALLNAEDKLFLLENPDVIDKILDGSVLESEAVREEMLEIIATAKHVDPVQRLFTDACKCVIRIKGIEWCECTPDDLDGHAHPMKTPGTEPATREEA